jgi:DNA-binding transcriptional LysR family regulator
MAEWWGVEPRHLAALVAVHRVGSFRGAAASLGIAQSAVSARIVQLEAQLDQVVIERSRGPSHVRMTEAGLALVEHAEEILSHLDAARADLRTLTTRPALRVGACESMASAVLPNALRWLRRDSPEMCVEVAGHADPTRFFARVSSAELDCAFAELPLEPGPFSFCELIADPCVLVVRADSPLPRAEKGPTLAEIGSLPLIAGCWPTLRLITEHLRAAGVEPRFVFSSTSNTGVQELVAHGVGVALMPRLAVNEHDSRITVVSPSDVLPPRRIALYWHRARRRDEHIARFLAAARASCSELAPVSRAPLALGAVA